MTSFQDAYQKLVSLTNLEHKLYTDSLSELKLSKKRMEDFLIQLGSPHKKIEFIHVAGTSGKGSVTNMIHHILDVDGQRVGSYTSPHTTTYLERFKLGRELMSPDILAKYIEAVIEEYQKFLKKGGPMSFFELSTCIAIYAMKKEGVDWCILETGCGGRWDATNVIPCPVVSVITNINKDHTDILGDSLAEIADKKAGIMKKGSIVLCGEMRPSLKKVFTEEAIKEQSALFFVPPPGEAIVDKKLGKSQQHNAALAERAALELGVSKSTIKRAFKTIRNLPCRFETIQTNPTIILDGAHSPAKIDSTVDMIKSLEVPVHIIFGCALNKDSEEMVKTLSKVATSITTTRFHHVFRKAANPATLLSYVPAKKKNKYFLDHLDALAHVKKTSKKGDAIVVTGSLFLAGEMREYWISESKILKQRSSFNI